MMAESTGAPRVKQEIDSSCCSPSPSSGHLNQTILYSSSHDAVSIFLNLFLIPVVSMNCRNMKSIIFPADNNWH